MRQPKQSMRQLKDAAVIERSTRAVEAIGDIAMQAAAKHAATDKSKPRFFRGALIKPK